MSDWLSVKDAELFLKLDASTIYRLCKAKQIPHRRIGTRGGRIVFTQADLDSYLDSCVVPVELPKTEPETLPVRLKYVRPQGSRRA
jgi:predicted DNA-binding transcriptional regulator AlpA